MTEIDDHVIGPFRLDFEVYRGVDVFIADPMDSGARVVRLTERRFRRWYETTLKASADESEAVVNDLRGRGPSYTNRPQPILFRLREIMTFGDGPELGTEPIGFAVTHLPVGYTAQINRFGRRWRILRTIDGAREDWAGAFDSAEDALLEVQAEWGVFA